MATTFLRAERRRLGKKLPTWDPLQLDTSAATSHRAGGRLPVSGYHGRSLSKSQKGMSTRSWRCFAERLIHTTSIRRFCLVTNDGDFAVVARRLREVGNNLGMGETNGLRSFPTGM